MNVVYRARNKFLIQRLNNVRYGWFSYLFCSGIGEINSTTDHRKIDFRFGQTINKSWTGGKGEYLLVDAVASPLHCRPASRRYEFEDDNNSCSALWWAWNVLIRTDNKFTTYYDDWWLKLVLVYEKLWIFIAKYCEFLLLITV